MKRKYINEKQLKYLVSNIIKEELNRTHLNEVSFNNFIRNIKSGFNGGKRSYQQSRSMNDIFAFSNMVDKLRSMGYFSSPQASNAIDVLTDDLSQVIRQIRGIGNNQNANNAPGNNSNAVANNNQQQPQGNNSNSWPNNYSYDYSPQQNTQQGYSYNYEIPQQPQQQPKKNRYEDYYNNQFGESVARRRINNLIREEMQNIMR